MRLYMAAAVVIALSSASAAQQAVSPSRAECDAAKLAPSMSGAEIERMTAQQKAAAKSKLEARITLLEKCLKLDARKSLKEGKAAVAEMEADCDRRGRPKIGMTPAELVETCWRKPSRIVKKTTAAGVEESYVYGIGHIVTVRDGKVAEIIEAR